MEYLFRAVDKTGRLIDFTLSDRRNTRAAHRFLAKALKTMRNWAPVSITTDKLDTDTFRKALGLRVKSAITLAGSYRKAAKESRIDHATLFAVARGDGANDNALCRVYLWLNGKLPPQP